MGLEMAAAPVVAGIASLAKTYLSGKAGEVSLLFNGKVC